jgi:hypothetical protein
MVKFGNNDPIKGYEAWHACTSWVRNASYPQEIDWGFVTKYEKELAKLNKHLNGWATRYQGIVLCDTSKDAWHEGKKDAKIARFKGVYESYPHFLIEVSFLRGYSIESADNSKWQLEITKKIVAKTELLKDFHSDDINFILKGAGHSPMTDFDVKNTKLTVLQYLEGSKRVPQSTKYGCCKAAYKAACNLYDVT